VSVEVRSKRYDCVHLKDFSSCLLNTSVAKFVFGSEHRWRKSGTD